MASADATVGGGRVPWKYRSLQYGARALTLRPNTTLEKVSRTGEFAGRFTGWATLPSGQNR